MICRYYAGDSEEEIACALAAHGAVIIEDLLGPDVIDALNADLRPEFDREGHLYQNSFNGHKTLRVGGVAKYTDYFPELLNYYLPSLL